MRYLIVGIDPGLTSAVAILNLKGKVISIRSKRNFGKNEIIEYIRSFGVPLIFSSDKSNAPSLVEKISANFDGIIFSPKEDISVEDKLDILSEYPGIKVSNVHERDALSSAVFAYRKYKDQFEKIDRTLSAIGMERFSDTVKKMIVRKEAKNISDALEKLTKKEENKVVKRRREVKKESKDKPVDIKNYKKRLAIQKEYIEKLESRIKKLESQKKRLLEEERIKNEKTREKIIKEREIRSRDLLIKQMAYEIKKLRNENSILKEKLKMMEEIEEIEYEGYVPVIIIDEFDLNKISDANKKIKIKDKVVYFKNYKESKKASKYLSLLQPAAVVIPEDNEVLTKAGIPVLKDVNIKFFDKFGGIDKKELERITKEKKRSNFLSWLEKYRARNK